MAANRERPRLDARPMGGRGEGGAAGGDGMGGAKHSQPAKENERREPFSQHLVLLFSNVLKRRRQTGRRHMARHMTICGQFSSFFDKLLLLCCPLNSLEKELLHLIY